MKKCKILLLLIAMVLFLSAGSELHAQGQCAIWNQQTNQIEQPPGNPIGIADVTQDNRAENFAGVPLSSLGVSCVIGNTDGQSYDADDLTPKTEEEEKEDNEIDPCKIPGNPFCNDGGGGGGGGGGGSGGGGSGGGGSGGGGSGGGGSGGGGSGGGGGASAQQVAQAARVQSNPKAGSAGSAGSIDTQGVLEAARGITDGGIAPVRLTDSLALDPLIEPRHLPAPSEVFPSAIVGGGGGGGGAGGIARTKQGAGGENESQRPGLGELYGYNDWKTLPQNNLGIDDEVLKTSMAMYMPKARLDLDYLNDKHARDRYLDQAKTVRGLTILAMGFLDVTLGTGMTDIQYQADGNTQAEIMKQVNWSLERLASPDRAQVFRDTDEKLEACLESALVNDIASEEISETTRKRVDFNCPKEACGDAPESENNNKFREEDTSDYSKHGNGSYQYCVCCASAESELNKLGEGSRTLIAKDGADERTWSLIERAVYGVMSDSEKKNHKEQVDKFVFSFIQLFGDVVLKTEEGNGNEPHLRHQYQMPQINLDRFIALHKNKCNHSSVPQANLDQEGQGCGIEEEERFGIQYGVCPSLKVILQEISELHRDGTRIKEQDVRLAEASLGIPITSGLLRALIYMLDSDGVKIGEGEERGRAFNAILAFCDNSAISAAQRQVLFYRRALNDILAINQHLSQRDKQLAINLIDRYLEQLKMLEMQEAAKARVNAVNTGIHLVYGRGLAGEIGSSTTAAVAQSNRSSIASNIAGFGGTQTGAGSGGSGGTLVSRTKGVPEKLSPEYEQRIADMTDRIERARKGGDAIDRGIASNFRKVLLN